MRGCPRGVMVKSMNSGIVVSDSDKYSWERYEPPYPPSYGLNSTTTVYHFLENGFGIK